VGQGEASHPADGNAANRRIADGARRGNTELIPGLLPQPGGFEGIPFVSEELAAQDLAVGEFQIDGRVVRRDRDPRRLSHPNASPTTTSASSPTAMR
jgi:hypothetical protein